MPGFLQCRRMGCVPPLMVPKTLSMLLADLGISGEKHRCCALSCEGFVLSAFDLEEILRSVAKAIFHLMISLTVI